MSKYGARFLAGGTTACEAMGLGSELDDLDQTQLAVNPAAYAYPIPLSGGREPQPQEAPRDPTRWSFLDKPLPDVVMTIEKLVDGYAGVHGTSGLLTDGLQTFIPTYKTPPVMVVKPEPIPPTPTSYQAVQTSAPEPWLATPGAKLAGAILVGGFLYKFLGGR